MFDKKVTDRIKKKVLKDMKMYSVKTHEYKDFIPKKLDYEFNKFKEDNVNDFNKIAIYDDKYEENSSNNFNIVYDEYVGKNPLLKIKNSYEDETLFKYIKNNKPKNVVLIFNKVFYSIIYSYRMLFVFNNKNVFLSFLQFILNIFSLFIKSIFILIVGFFCIINYILFKLLKVLFRLKYKRNIFLKDNILIIFAIFILKTIISSINGFFMLFNDIFINNIDVFLNSTDDFINDFLYVNGNVYNNNVDRYTKTNEQKDFLQKIKKDRLEYMNLLLKDNIDYFKNIDFIKLSVKSSNYLDINNPYLKEFYMAKEKEQKIKIKKEIITDRLVKKNEKTTKKENLFVNKIGLINDKILFIANKDKQLYKMLVKKFGKKGLEI